MKTEFKSSIRRFSFLCRLPDIKIAWINPCFYINNYVLGERITKQAMRLKLLVTKQKEITKLLPYMCLASVRI